MSLPKIKIVLNAAGRGGISLDGYELPGVQAINVRCRAGKLTKVFLQLVGDVEIEAQPSVINAEVLGIPVTVVRGDPK